MTDLSIQQYANERSNSKTTVTPTQVKIGAEILIQQLHKLYGEVQVLENLDLHIQAGEFIAIVGRSGCGKSTLLRLVADLEQPSSGAIKFKSAQNFKEGILSSDIRVMFQDPRLLPWKNVRQNIQLGLKIQNYPKVQQLLEKVGLESKADFWPTQLSGGQRQRIALARALSHTPKILLLDEPLGALDALTRLDMQRLIEQLWREQGFTAILVTHDVNEAVQLADRIILLDQGHIAQQFKVDLPRPRQKNVMFAEIEQKVLQAVLAT